MTLMFVSSPCFGQSQAQEGAIVGGIAGAILGGIAGHQNDETPEGIAIGGAVGAIAGGLLGRAKEDQMIRDYQTQRIQSQQYAQRVKAAVSVNDVIALARSGVGDALIINQIRSKGVRQEIGVNEIITMHQNGVTETVINQMQRTWQAGPVPTAVIQSRPVIVDQRPIVVGPRPITFEYRRPVVYPQPTIVIQRHGSHYHAAPVRSTHKHRPPGHYRK